MFRTLHCSPISPAWSSARPFIYVCTYIPSATYSNSAYMCHTYIDYSSATIQDPTERLVDLYVDFSQQYVYELILSFSYFYFTSTFYSFITYFYILHEHTACRSRKQKKSLDSLVFSPLISSPELTKSPRRCW